MVHALSPVSPFLPQPTTVKAVPGFDKAGAPLTDDQVWARSIGADKRALNTATGSGPGHIDAVERRHLMELASKTPQEFMQRLLADSMNGTPVEYNFTKELSIGVLKVSFKAVDGAVTTTASIDVFNKSADQFLKPYLAQNARDKGARARIAIEVKGQLNKNGGLDGATVEARASNVPSFSVKKLIGIATIESDIKKAMAAASSKKTKQAEVLSLVNGVIEKLSDVPLPFLVKLIGDSGVFKAELTSKGHDGKAKVEIGGGKYSVGLQEFLGKAKNEPDVRAKLTGHAAEDTLAVDELRVFTNDKLSVEWNDEGSAKLYRTDKKGEKTEVEDHFGQVLAYLPIALALAGTDKIL